MSDLDFRLVVDLLEGAVVVGDRTGRIRYANAAAERLLRWPAGELTGQPLTAIIPPSLRGRHTAGFNRYRSTWVPRVLGRGIRVPALRRDGVEVRVELTLSAFRGRGGEELYVAALREGGTPRAEETPRAAGVDPLRALAAAGSRLAPEPDTGRFAERLSDTLSAFFGARLTRLWVYDAASETLLLPERVPLMPELGETTRRLPAGGAGPLAEAARSRRPIVNNRPREDLSCDAAWLVREGVTALAAVPLLHLGELQGVLLHLSTVELTEELATALALFGGSVGTVLREARHREEAGRRERSEARERISRELLAAAGSGRPLEAVLELVLERGLALTGLDEGSVLLWSPERDAYVVRACAGYKTSITGLAVPRGTGLTSMVVEAGRGMAVDDYQRLPQAVPRIRQRGVRLALGAPVRLGEAVIGALKLESKRAERVRQADDLEAVEMLAAYVSLALRLNGL